MDVAAHRPGDQIVRRRGAEQVFARRHVGILEQLFLVRRIEPWFRNDLRRIVKTPKLHFPDSGLLATLTGRCLRRTGC